MNNAIMDGMKGFGKVFFAKIRQAKPEIALGFGILGLAAGTVYACTKTKKAVDVIETMKDELDEIDQEYTDGLNQENLTEDAIKDLKKIRFQDKFIVYFKAGLKFGKIYAVPMLLWGGGLSSIIFAHADLKHQNSKLLFNSLALRQMFEEYRERVRREVGEEHEKEIYFGAEEGDYEVVEEDPETGNKVKKKTKGRILSQNTGSQFARNFNSETSYGFEARSYADFFVELHRTELNKKLKNVPFLTVNDVYDEFQMKPAYGRCLEGLDWGWRFDPLDPENKANEIQITWLEGQELVKNEYSGEYEWLPSLRFDLNPRPLKEIL